MRVYYLAGKANVVADVLSRLSMGSVAHVEEERKELVKDVYKLACLGVRLMRISASDVIVQNGAKSSIVVEVKESKTMIQSFLNLRVQSIIREWRFSPKGDMMYFPAKVDCVFLMWVS